MPLWRREASFLWPEMSSFIRRGFANQLVDSIEEGVCATSVRASPIVGGFMLGNVTHYSVCACGDIPQLFRGVCHARYHGTIRVHN
eukprot:1765441-Prymnesium_polylepis.1